MNCYHCKRVISRHNERGTCARCFNTKRRYWALVDKRIEMLGRIHEGELDMFGPELEDLDKELNVVEMEMYRLDPSCVWRGPADKDYKSNSHDEDEVA